MDVQSLDQGAFHYSYVANDWRGQWMPSINKMLEFLIFLFLGFLKYYAILSQARTVIHEIS